MPNYDIFFDNEHPKWAQKFLVSMNTNVVKHLFHVGIPKNARILEVGPGKGYFYQAVQKFPTLRYSACDQNPRFSEFFPEQNFIQASVPPLPVFTEKFDVIYAAYIVEHLTSGAEVQKFVVSCKEQLAPGGLLVLLCPDALRQKIEFWNMDYTHIYPTTKRNMAMIVQDAGLSLKAMKHVNGLLTLPGFGNPLVSWSIRVLLAPYWYPLWHFLFGWIFKKPLYSLQNPFYQLYCLVKQANIFLIAKNEQNNHE